MNALQTTFVSLMKNLSHFACHNPAPDIVLLSKRMLSLNLQPAPPASSLSRSVYIFSTTTVTNKVALAFEDLVNTFFVDEVVHILQRDIGLCVYDDNVQQH